MIPKVVHQLWLAPDNSLESQQPPADIIRNIQSWNTHHPDFAHCLWTESLFKVVFKGLGYEEILSVLQVMAFPTMRSNMIRLCLLIQFGGFWSDLKNVVQRPFLTELLQEELVLAEHQPMPEARPAGYLTNSFLGAKPRHPFLETVLAEAVMRISRREEGSLSRVTGLVLLNSLVKAAEENQIMPPYHFLTCDQAWRDRMRRVSASYQSGGRHWSILQKARSLYLP